MFKHRLNYVMLHGEIESIMLLLKFIGTEYNFLKLK
jgi:hypothetical protein